MWAPPSTEQVPGHGASWQVQRPPEQVLRAGRPRVRAGPQARPPPSWQADSGLAQACLPPYRDWSPLAPPESRWPLPQAPGGSRPVAPGHSPQGASQERPSQGGSREQRAGPGALPVGAACGVAGPWSVGGPIVHAGAPGYGDAARLADVVQHHPCRDRQAVWHVPHCLLRGRGERRGPCPPQACPRGLLGPRGHGTPQGLRPGTRDASV